MRRLVHAGVSIAYRPPLTRVPHWKGTAALTPPPAFEEQEPGSGYPLQLVITPYPINEYQPEPVIDHVTKQPVLMQSRKAEVDGVAVRRVQYEIGWEECENDFVDVLEIPRGSEMVVLEFSFGISGRLNCCDRVARGFEDRCARAKQSLIQLNQAVITEMIDSIDLEKMAPGSGEDK